MTTIAIKNSLDAFFTNPSDSKRVKIAKAAGAVAAAYFLEIMGIFVAVIEGSHYFVNGLIRGIMGRLTHDPAMQLAAKNELQLAGCIFKVGFTLGPSIALNSILNVRAVPVPVVVTPALFVSPS